MSRIMEEHRRIAKIMDKFTHEIATEVDFEYLKPYLRNVFTRQTLQRAEGRERGSYDIMGRLCDSARTLSMRDFLQFLAAIRTVSRHVYDHINEDYKEMTGNNLIRESVPSFSQNAPIPPQNAPIPPQNAPIPPRNAPIFPQNASVPPQNAESLGPNSTTVGFMEICDPKEMTKPEEFHSSHSVSGLRAEVAELNMVSGHINYVSFGAAVPCLSDQLPPPDNPVSIGNAAQLPNDFLESNQTPTGSREQSSKLRKYYKSISKEPGKVYKMDSFPRGHCLIINNEKFENFSYRGGSSKDLEKLGSMFKCLGFEVLPYENKTAREMTTLLKEFSKSPALAQISSLAVGILSHGGPNESIYGKDGALDDKKSPVAGTFISRLELQHIFNGTNCPSMIGKPKLFILQACRGDEEDDRDRSNLGVNENQQESHISRDGGISLDHTMGDETESDHPSPDDGHRAETADMCFLHSSSLGYKSYRSKYEGSPFIQDFTEEVMKHASEKSFQDMVMTIQKDFSTKRIGSRKMTMPEHFTCLTRKLFFNPPVGRAD